MASKRSLVSQTLINQAYSLVEQQNFLREAYTSRRDIVRDKFGLDLDSLQDKINNQLFDLSNSYYASMAKTGLAKSGTVTRQRDIGKERIGESFNYAKDTLELETGSELAELQIDEATKIGETKQQLSKLRLDLLKTFKYDKGLFSELESKMPWLKEAFADLGPLP